MVRVQGKIIGFTQLPKSPRGYTVFRVETDDKVLIMDIKGMHNELIFPREIDVFYEEFSSKSGRHLAFEYFLSENRHPLLHYVS